MCLHLINVCIKQQIMEHLSKNTPNWYITFWAEYLNQKTMAKQKVNTETGEVIAQPVDVMNLPQYPWNTQFNFKPEPKKTEFGKGQTIPGQSLPLSEIINRYQQGRSLVVHQKEYGGYDLEQELPDLRKMDLVEIHQLKEENDQKLKQIRDKQQAEEKRLKQLAEAQAREKWFQEELKRREAANPPRADK